ncbi:MAG: SDR family NAD-dependent epimerase/dehydratase, partial [bacterium]
LSDAIRVFDFIIKNDMFDNRIYNVLTENLTVNSIIDFIKKHIPDIFIQYVDAKIMNQLSYNVSNERIKSKGFELKGSIEKTVEETINLLKGAMPGIK